MLRPVLGLGIALAPVLAFIALACSSTSGAPDSGPPGDDSGAAPPRDAGTTPTAAEDAPTAVDSSAAADSGDGSAAADAASSEDVASVCVGCASRLSVDGPLAPTCTDDGAPDGAPSSHQLLENWGECLCVTSSCAATCAVCANGQAAITQACINCGHEQCPAQYAACAADTVGYTPDDAGD